MSERPLVSVITPCFKTERYLKIFLDRLPDQTFFNQTEFILDMNAPSQVEREILKNFLKLYPDRLKVLFSKDVANISTSMNRAIYNSDADFVAIWNVDDLRKSNSLEVQYRALLATKKPSFTIDSYEVVSNFGHESGRLVKHENLSQSTLLAGMYLGPFFMFSRKVTDQIGYFDEQLFSGADFDFAIRLARVADPVYPQGIAGFYLDAGLGASTRPNSLQALERTVIELRYGVFHKIDHRFVYPASQYVIPALLNDNQFVKLNTLFKDYDEYIRIKLTEIENNDKDSYFSNLCNRLLVVLKKVLKPINKRKASS
jgi:glycosyltransferase involved in cell wall biosynthesis